MLILLTLPILLITFFMSVYNNFAGEFSDTRQYLWDDLKPLLKYTRNGDKVLDLGCGNGRLYQLFDGMSIDYIGLDASEELIKKAQEKFPEVNFAVGDMRELPFPDDRYDVIYSIAAFHHLDNAEDRLKALSEIRRILKTGGKVVMTNWNLLGQWGSEQVEKEKYMRWENDFTVPFKNGEGKILGERFYHAFDLGELENLFSEARFKIEENYYVKKGEKSNKGEGENIISILKI